MSVFGLMVLPSIVLSRPKVGVPQTIRLSSLVCSGPLILSLSVNEISFWYGQPFAVVDARAVRYFSAHLVSA